MAEKKEYPLHLVYSAYYGVDREAVDTGIKVTDADLEEAKRTVLPNLNLRIREYIIFKYLIEKFKARIGDAVEVKANDRAPFRAELDEWSLEESGELSQAIRIAAEELFQSDMPIPTDSLVKLKNTISESKVPVITDGMKQELRDILGDSLKFGDSQWRWNPDNLEAGYKKGAPFFRLGALIFMPPKGSPRNWKYTWLHMTIKIKAQKELGQL